MAAGTAGWSQSKGGTSTFLKPACAHISFIFQGIKAVSSGESPIILDLGQAAAYYQQALSENRGLVEAYFKLGLISTQTGDCQKTAAIVETLKDMDCQKTKELGLLLKSE